MDDERIARIDALLGLPDAELRARFEAGRVGRLLAWAVTRPDDELKEYGLPHDQDGRFEMLAWALALTRRRPEGAGGADP
jgi:hypothetical protein